MTRLELQIAWRYLRSRRGSKLLSLISIIAIGGVLVGVSALIVIIGVMNGLQHDLREKILVGSPDIRVLSYGEDLKITDWPKVLDKVRKQPGVVTAAPFVLTEALMRRDPDLHRRRFSRGDRAAGAAEPEVTTIREHAIEGDFRFASADGKHRGAVVGSLLAEPDEHLDRFTARAHHLRRLQGEPGHRLHPIPRTLEVEVTGVFRAGMYEYDNQYVYLDMPAAQELAGLDSAVTGLEVKATTRAEAPAVAEAMHVDFPYHTVDWHEQNSSLFKALKLEKLGMGVILLLIVLVAAFNIVSTLTMVVPDKTREIGILKAMGLPSASVRRIFLAQGLVIGVVGTGHRPGDRARRGSRDRPVGPHLARPSGLFHRPPAGADAAAGRRADRRPRRHHRDGGDAASRDSGVAALPDRGDPQRVTSSPAAALPGDPDVMTPMLEAIGVVKGLPWRRRCRGACARREWTSAVARGEMIAIVGASGAGKSTLMHVLGALERPTAGDVWLNGEHVADLPDDALADLRNRSVGFVFQFHHLLKEFSALENVMMPLRIAGRSPAEARDRAASLLVRVGLGARHEPPSSGDVGRRAAAHRRGAGARDAAAAPSGRRALGQSRPSQRRRLCTTCSPNSRRRWHLGSSW